MGKKLKLKIIACKVLMRELYKLAYESENIVDILRMKQELHNNPDELRMILQRNIDRIDDEDEDYDAILLGYCLCSNGIVGLHSKKYSIIVPKGHDCVTLLLGSKETYNKKFFGGDGGIYWYSPGWIEHTEMPSEDRYLKTYDEYALKYGEDNAKYLMNMEQNWMSEYDKAIYIDWKSMSKPKCIEFSKQCARYMNWEFEQVIGSEKLLTDFIAGNWDDRFILIPSNMRIRATFDEDIIGFE